MEYNKEKIKKINKYCYKINNLCYQKNVQKANNYFNHLEYHVMRGGDGNAGDISEDNSKLLESINSNIKIIIDNNNKLSEVQSIKNSQDYQRELSLAISENEIKLKELEEQIRLKLLSGEKQGK